MSNQPPFDPLNPTPEQEQDMLSGYLTACRPIPMPDLASMAFEHGWRMRRNDMAEVVDDDQKELARRMFEQSLERAGDVRKDARERRQRLRSALRGPSEQFKL
jgi:hypothetical protein